MFPRYFKLKPPKKRKIREKDSKDPIRSTITDYGTKCSSSESDDLEDIYEDKPKFENYDYPNDYWKFQKSMKYLACGKPLITTLCFINTLDCDFQDPIMLKALHDYRVIEILLNVLGSHEKRLQLISLRFLQKLSTIRTMRHKIVCLGGIESLVELLRSYQIDIKQAVAETITKVADYHKAWRSVGSCGGIALLANMIYVPKQLLFESDALQSKQCLGVISAAEAAAGTIYAVCSCRKNQIEFLNCGGLRGCQNILKTTHTKLAATVMLIVQRCAAQKKIKLAIKDLKMLEEFRKHFYSEDQTLMQAAAQAAYICAEGEDARTFFEKAGFVDKLYEIIQRSTFHSDDRFMIAISGALWKSSENEANAKRLQLLNGIPFLLQLLSSQFMIAISGALWMSSENEANAKRLQSLNSIPFLLQLLSSQFMIAISGALWKSSENEANAKRLQSLNGIPFLLQLLSSQSAKVQEHIVACLTCCMAGNPQSRTAVRKNNGIEVLIELLHTIHAPLIMHLNKALAIASSDAECLALMEKYNALRLIWSHLKNSDPSVIANTAWQLTDILKNIDNSAAYIRSLVGGVQLLTDLLCSEHTRVLTPVCALIVILSREEENLRILTDYQVVKRLSNLTRTRCCRLRYYLCMAIKMCSNYKDNRQEFARRKIVFPLLKMLSSKSAVVAGAATHALNELSWIPYWCAVMYNTRGAYEILIEQMKHEDQEVQQCAADIIQRMRLFALNRDGNVPDWMIEKHAQFFKN